MLRDSSAGRVLQTRPDRYVLYPLPSLKAQNVSNGVVKPRRAFLSANINQSKDWVGFFAEFALGYRSRSVRFVPHRSLQSSFIKVHCAHHCRVGVKLFILDTLLPAFLVEITPGIAAHPATALGGRIRVPAQRGRIALPACADRMIEGAGFFQSLQMMASDSSNDLFHELPVCRLCFVMP